MKKSGSSRKKTKSKIFWGFNLKPLDKIDPQTFASRAK